MTFFSPIASHDVVDEFEDRVESVSLGDGDDRCGYDRLWIVCHYSVHISIFSVSFPCSSLTCHALQSCRGLLERHST